MSFERFTRHELIPSKENVLKLMQEKGVDTPESLTALNSWLDAQEERVSNGDIDDFDFNLALAELYRDAGLIENAREGFMACMVIANNEGDDKRLLYCESELAKLD